MQSAQISSFGYRTSFGAGSRQTTSLAQILDSLWKETLSLWKIWKQCRSSLIASIPDDICLCLRYRSVSDIASTTGIIRPILAKHYPKFSAQVRSANSSTKFSLWPNLQSHFKRSHLSWSYSSWSQRSSDYLLRAAYFRTALGPVPIGKCLIFI